eukprot:6987570-Pyramimonas_sp.AAC.1
MEAPQLRPYVSLLPPGPPFRTYLPIRARARATADAGAGLSRTALLEPNSAGGGGREGECGEEDRGGVESSPFQGAPPVTASSRRRGVPQGPGEVVRTRPPKRPP